MTYWGKALLALPLLFSWLAGCSEDANKNELRPLCDDCVIPNCDYAENTQVSNEERTSLDYSKTEFVQALTGTWHGTITFKSDLAIEMTPPSGTTDLRLDLSPTGEPRFFASPAAQNPRRLCPGQMKLSAIASLRTADGSFDENWKVELESSDSPQITSKFSKDLVESPPQGSFRATWKDLSPGETSSLSVDVMITSEDATGQIVLSKQGTRSDSTNMGYGSAGIIGQWVAKKENADTSDGGSGGSVMQHR